MWFKYGLKGRAACGFLMVLEASVPQGVWGREVTIQTLEF